jgi:hypothetical protein
MPRTIWKKFLESTPKDRKKQTPNAQAKLRHDIRKRAMQCIEDLILILEKMNNVSSKPERDFAKIFRDDTQYFELLKTLDWAWRESYNKTVKLADPENFRILYQAATEAGLGVYSEKMRYDRNHRLDIRRRLQRKSKADGVDYLAEVRQEILHRETLRHYGTKKNLVPCPKCGHEQEIMSYIDCPKCGYDGPVIGDLYDPS